MKVAILGSLPPLRGLSSYCFELVRALVDLGEIEFISFRKMYPARLYPGGDLREDFTFPQLNHRNLRFRRQLAWNRPWSWLHEALRAQGDLLHVQWWSLPLAPIYAVVCLGFKLRGKPVVFTVHNVDSHEKSRAYKLICRMLFKFGDHFVVHSASNKESLIADYELAATKVSRIPHGPLDLHVRNGASRAALLSELDLQPENKVLLMYGAIRPYKGIETSLKAFAEVQKVIPECRLLIAGKLWESWDRYKALIEGLQIGDRVLTRLGYIPSAEVHKYFEVADLVLLPYHRFAAQSGVGATALAFGKPMIVAGVGGLPELVLDDRYVVPPNDAPALAGKITACLQDPLELGKMSSEAGAVARRMSWPVIARTTWSLYESLVQSAEHSKMTVAQ